MKKIAYPVLAALLVFACGGNKPTNSNQGITVTVEPSRALINLGGSYHFYCTVSGTDNHAATWSVDGSPLNGSIDSTGYYVAPFNLPANVDSAMITVRSRADLAKSATAWAVLVDPNKIYVQPSGSDSSGLGTRWYPYRSITKALTRAHQGQFIMVAAGEYSSASGESFPLIIPSAVTVQGAGRDVTFVIGPGGMDPRQDAIFAVNGDVIIVTGFSVKSADSLGVGFWVRPGILVSISQNQISGNYIGIYTSGRANPVITGNVIAGDSLGIVAADSSAPVIRNNTITNCQSIGVEILNSSHPDLGDSLRTGLGGNTIRECGGAYYHWLVYNESPDSIWAVGNTWQDQSGPQYNDIFIYDDEESGNASGNVILTQP